MDAVNKWITLIGISCGFPAQGLRFEYFSFGIIATKKMRAKGNAESLVDVLVNQDSASGKRDSQVRGFNLKNNPLKGDGVVVPYCTLFFGNCLADRSELKDRVGFALSVVKVSVFKVCKDIALLKPQGLQQTHVGSVGGGTFR